MWNFVKSTPRSAIAFVVVLALGLLSMGLLGAGLYYVVMVALPPTLPHIDTISGDWAWPAVIVIGMFWSVGFLIAGALNARWIARGMKPYWRKLCYVIALWLWAYLLWLIALYGRIM
ncbi:MAG: hypothetical protein EAZ43_05670 [Betaproteobacteria bacterium]|nr:MAG: hypothetical protein EAZ43_05670 [Betaproteobacteria bacterium]